jgi:meso-butanediol dehydrogenase/(S,S)-butanediol dehydrogenase/diacetyl reductase
MALQWAPRVRVNCVCPAVIETPMTAELRANPTWSEAVLQRYPMKRFGRPEEVAAAILFLASDDASYVTGVALPVDGGYTAA